MNFKTYRKISALYIQDTCGFEANREETLTFSELFNKSIAWFSVNMVIVDQN